MASKHKSSAQALSLEQAVGKVLAHDITEIRPGEFKGPAFKKGYVLKVEDLEHLRRLGKEHLYALEIAEGELHEDQAALRLAKALAGEGVEFDPNPSEGKITLKAGRWGLLKVDAEALTDFNMVPDISCSSRKTNVVVKKGEPLAGTRAIPLIIDEKLVEEAEAVGRAAGGILRVAEMKRAKVGLLITGNEVFYGRITDKFRPVIEGKMKQYKCELIQVAFSPDDLETMTAEIKKLSEAGCEVILVAGGMSVDPDDISRLAIAQAGAEDIVYGTPVLPGAMFLYGRLNGAPILGLPACLLYFKATVFDLVFPRVLAGEKITRRELAELAHGGYCLNCQTCRYPVCPFGK